MDWFREDVDTSSDQALAIASARECLDWASQAYHKKFLTFLEREASRPLDLSDNDKLVALAARSNTYREVLEMIRRETAESEQLVSRVREGE